MPKYRARRVAVSALTARGRSARKMSPIRVAARNASVSALADRPSGFKEFLAKNLARMRADPCHIVIPQW
jgi:hypothetical protein